jgi:hypothetical protein
VALSVELLPVDDGLDGFVTLGDDELEVLLGDESEPEICAEPVDEEEELKKEKTLDG